MDKCEQGNNSNSTSDGFSCPTLLLTEWRAWPTQLEIPLQLLGFRAPGLSHLLGTVASYHNQQQHQYQHQIVHHQPLEPQQQQQRELVPLPTPQPISYTHHHGSIASVAAAAAAARSASSNLSSRLLTSLICNSHYPAPVAAAGGQEMLHRSSSSRSGTPRRHGGLSRSKSTVSVRTSGTVDELELLDPAVARRDARLAARLSFTRAQERKNGASGTRTEMAAVSEATASRGEGGGGGGDQGLRRSQSIRFTGPAAAPAGHGPPRTSSIGKAMAATPAPAVNTLTRRYLDTLAAAEEYYTPEDDIASAPSSYRRLRQSKSMFPLFEPSESSYYFNGDGNGRGRGPGSLSHAGAAAGPSRSAAFSLADPECGSAEPLKERNATLRAPKSMSFLKGLRGTGHRVASREEADIAIRTAEDTLREQVEQQQQQQQQQQHRNLSSYGSMFFRKTKQWNPSVASGQGCNSSIRFRRTLRNTSDSDHSHDLVRTPSNQTAGSTWAWPALAPTTRDGGAGLRQKARKVSRTFKNKIKAIIFRGQTRTGEATTVNSALAPRASAAAVSDAAATTTATTDHGRPGAGLLELAVMDRLPAEQAAISRGPGRMADYHVVPANQQLHSSRVSMESARSGRETAAAAATAIDDCDNNTEVSVRILSWTTAGAGSIKSECPPPHGSASTAELSDFERQRLSVIEENGIHVASSSSRHPGKGALDLEQQPGPGPENADTSTPRARPPRLAADNRRLVSALVKKLAETARERGGANPDRLSQMSIDEFEKHGVPPPRSSSIMNLPAQQHRPGTPPTIRCVIPEDDVFGAGPSKPAAASGILSRATLPGQDKDVASGSRQASNSTTDTVVLNNHDGRGVAALSKYALSDTSESQAGSLEKASPPVPARPVTNRRSAFFASPDCHLFRTASPYRRAIQEAIVASQSLTEADRESTAPPSQHPFSISQVSVPTQCLGRTQPLVRDDGSLDDSESVYSNVTDDAAAPNAPTTSQQQEVSQMEQAGSSQPGVATIILPSEQYPVYHLEPRVEHRNISNASSVEWKTWLASSVERLETVASRPDESTRCGAMSPPQRGSVLGGHVREATAITEEDPTTPPPPRPSTGSDSSHSLRTQPCSQARAGAATPEPGSATQLMSPSSSPAKGAGRPRLPLPLSLPAPPPGPPPPPPKSPLRYVRSWTHRGDEENSSPAGLPVDRDSGSATKPTETTSLLRMRALNTGRAPADRSSPLATPPRPTIQYSRRRSNVGAGAGSAASSPGLTAAVERQFGRAAGRNEENVRPEAGGIPAANGSASAAAGKGGDDQSIDSPHNTRGAAGPVPFEDVDGQGMGSRRMVELFLSSRRSRGNGGGADGGDESGGTAFL